MIKLLLISVMLLLIPFSTRADNTLLSAFDGSVELLRYNSRFSPLTLLVSPLDSQKNPSSTVVEGTLDSRIFKRPENVSDFEIYKSYLSTLKSSGFDVLLACEKNTCNITPSAKKVYWHPNNEIVNRPYQRSIKSAQVRETQFLAGWASYYISASKTIENQIVYAMVIISKQHGLYSIDELIATAMESNTVTLNLDGLKDKLKNEGKVVLDGLFFKTASSVLSDDSNPALDTVAQYLKLHQEQSFYVVGHTDDIGSLDGNLALSRTRAESVIKALQSYGIKGSRLSPYGVGPYSPASSNSSENGRQLNRRVELVLRVP